MKKVFALALVLVMALGLALTGCGGGGGSSSTPPPASTGGSGVSTPEGGGDDSDTGGGDTPSNVNVKDSITMNLSNIVAKLDPQYGAAQWEWTVNTNIYETLWRYPKMDQSNPPQPWLCESHEISDDGLVWNLKLREGVKFHDGSDFTAEDVAYMMERAQVSPYTAPATGYIDTVEVVDDFNLTVTLAYAFPATEFMAVFADYQWGIASKNAIETFGEGDRQAVVGTGPYQLSEWNDDNTITLTYFEDHWAPEPAIKQVTYRAIPDYSASAIALRAGELDVLWYGVTAADAISFIDDPDYTVLQFDRSLTQGITFNNQVAPFNDVRVRQAICHAIDKDAVNLIAEEGVNNTENTIVKTTPNMEGYDKALSEGRLTVYEYDVEKAKALLAEAGYDENNPLNVPYISTSSTFAQGMASAVQAQLAMVNVNIDIEVMESSAWIQRVGAADFVMSFNDSGCWPDKSSLVYYFMHAQGLMYNRENLNNARVTEITLQGMRTPDKAEREELYAELLEIVSAEAVACPLFQKRGLIVSIKGLKIYPETMVMVVPVYDIEWET